MISHSHIHLAVLLLVAMIVRGSTTAHINHTAANHEEQIMLNNIHSQNSPSGDDCDFDQDFYIASSASASTPYIKWYKSLQSASSSSSAIKNHHANKQGVLRVRGTSTSSTVTITLYVYNPVGVPFHIADSPNAYGTTWQTYAEIYSSDISVLTLAKGTAAFQVSSALMKMTGYSTYQIKITRRYVTIDRLHPPSEYGREYMYLYESYMFVMNQYMYIAINRKVKDGWHGAGVYHVCINAN